MDHDIPSDAPKPRLCHLRKRPDFAGYGFNLHAEKGKSGQFIGKVDEGSPAHLAGLREGDRIIEVNGTNVGSENHQQVVQRIKAVADETKFLVLDREADDYYRDRKVVVRGDMHNVVVLVTPAYHADGGGSNGTDSKHRARLCHLKIWPEFTGYGFNLHAEKGKIVQYIGKVDKNSPAELAGLKEHDRIVEVNGTSVSGESHQDVVKRIKSDPKQVTMLVVDKESDAYFVKEGVVVSAHMHNIDRINCPDVQPFIDHDRHHSNDVDKSGPSHKPRLCHIKERGDGKGFGFNLQAEKGKLGQFIGKVDPGSPAEAAGLRDGDRLVEVNGFNVENTSHDEVVTRIRSNTKETTLLVIDKAGYEHYHAKGVVVTTSMLVVSVSRSSSASSDDHKQKSSAAENFKPRLCHVKERGDGKGFGFNLQAAKGKPGQFIGKVDHGSPADLAGLRDGDRLVEVNGVNVESTSHKDVVMKIKSIPNETTLLVIDMEGYEHYHARGVVVTAGMLTSAGHSSHSENGRDEHHHKEGSTSSHKDADDDDQHIAAAAAVAAAVEGERDDSDNESRGSRDDDGKKVDEHHALAAEGHEHVEKDATAAGHDAGHDHQAAEVREEHVATAVKAAVVEAKAEEVVKKAEVEKKREEKKDEKKPDKANLSLNVTAASSTTKVSTTSSGSMSPIESPKSPVVVGGIEFAGTAEEARRKMSKKRNVKETSMSLKAKYDLFQKL